MFDYVYDWVPNSKQQVVTSPTKRESGVGATSPTPREEAATSAKPTPPRSPVTLDTRHIASVSYLVQLVQVEVVSCYIV